MTEEASKPRDREAHVLWCKERAREYLKEYDIDSAVASMISDMEKHPECKVHPAIKALGLMIVSSQDPHRAEQYIEGFR